MNDRLTNVFLILFCGFFFFQTTLIDSKNLTGFTATLFPRILLSIIALLAIFMLIKSFVKPKQVSEQKEIVSSVKEEEKGGIVWVLFGCFGVYAFLINIIGFIISSFLFMSVAYLILIRKKVSVKQHAIAIGGLFATSIILSLIFENVLKVLLPKGIFF